MKKFKKIQEKLKKKFDLKNPIFFKFYNLKN